MRCSDTDSIGGQDATVKRGVDRLARAKRVQFLPPQSARECHREQQSAHVRMQPGRAGTHGVLDGFGHGDVLSCARRRDVTQRAAELQREQRIALADIDDAPQLQTRRERPQPRGQ